MCLVLTSEETAIISLYNINWLVFIIERECLLRGTELSPFKCNEFNLRLQRINKTGISDHIGKRIAVF